VRRSASAALKTWIAVSNPVAPTALLACPVSVAGKARGFHSSGADGTGFENLRNHPEIEFATLTDIGCQRQRNEDSSAYWLPDAFDELERKGSLAIIADGMGGYEGGQEASHIAVQTVCDTFAKDAGTPQSLLVSGMKAAHERIREYARQHPKLFGMGTTCTAVCVAQAYLYFAHIGDSRLYLVRRGNISRLTRDHSYVARLIESGLLSTSEAEAHPQRHILTAALGVGDDPNPDTPLQPLPLQNGDTLLLCTDGLWGLVSDEELLKSVRGHVPADACHELVHLAKHRGAPDNVTLQLLRFRGNGAAATGEASTAF